MKLAVDVVLLPPDDVMERAIRINKELLQQGHHGIALNKQTCLPHISLNMGVMEEQSLPEVRVILNDIARRFLPLHLAITQVNVNMHKEGREISDFTVEKTKELQKLHEMVMKKLATYVIHGEQSGVLRLSGEEKPELMFTQAWVKNYAHDSSFERFYPHITLGFGRAVDDGLPLSFTATKLALCHLGNYCTCRKVLWEKTFLKKYKSVDGIVGV